MKLKLQTFTGRKMQVDLGDDPDVERTIDFTRDMIEEQFGIPAYRIVLMFEGEKLLQLDALLEDYNVDDGDLLWVIVDTRAKKPRRKEKRGQHLVGSVRRRVQRVVRIFRRYEWRGVEALLPDSVRTVRVLHQQRRSRRLRPVPELAHHQNIHSHITRARTSPSSRAARSRSTSAGRTAAVPPGPCCSSWKR